MTRRRTSALKWTGTIVQTLALVTLIIASSGENALAAGNNVSNTPGPSSGPYMVLSGDDVYVAWEEFLESNLEIFFAFSNDGGATFSEAVNLSNTVDGTSSTPKVAASGDNVYVVWQDTFPANDIFIATSTDGGQTFGDPINVSNSTASATPQIAVFADSVYLAWEDSASGNPDIYFAASTDGGANFGDPINVSNTTDGFSSTPRLAVSAGGNIYLGWVDAETATDVFFASSSDGGLTFSGPVNISNSEGGSPSLSGIAAAGDNIYLVWRDVIPVVDIFVASSTDAGANFGEPVNVSANDGVSVTPVIAVLESDPSALYVAWVDNTGLDSFDIFFSASSDDGSTFSEAINVSNTSGSSTNPRIVADSLGNVTVGWSDGTLDPAADEVLVAVSGDAGGTFGSSINISNSPTSSALSQLAVSPSNGTLNILWVDQTDPLDVENTEILLVTDINTAIPSITIDSVSTPVPRWQVDSVEVSGTVGNPADGDRVSVNWGDGTITADIIVSGSSWGPVEHSYAASAIAANPNLITAQLFGSGGAQKAISEASEVNVQKHAVTIALDPVLSPQEGTEVAVSGVVTDADTEEGLEGLEIEFTGSGAEAILANVTTESDGTFAITGVAPSASEGLQVQALYAGSDLFESSESAIRVYDSVGDSAIPFEVSAGEDSLVDLVGFGFNATVNFEEVVADGTLYASECASPESSRYIALEMCLQLSSAVEMAANSSALVTFSFEGQELPEGSTASDIDIFHEHAGSIVDITTSRDESDETVTGRVTEFSKFIAGVALHEEKPAGTMRQQVFVGDGNVVSIRADKLGNSSETVQASFDQSRYRVGDRPILTIIDENGNIDSGQNDTILAAVLSDTSSPFNIILSLTESGPDTSTFTGDFGLDRSVTSSELGVVQISAGDQLSTFYLSGGRAQAVIDGVSESGAVDLSDFIVDEGVCFKPIGAAIDLRLVDAELGPDGKITSTLSYANANLRGFDPQSFLMVHKEGASWLDRTVSVDTDAMTVTGESALPGPFTIATDFGSCGGGSGGGLGRPGSGLVVDFVASIARSSSGGGGGGASVSSGTSNQAQPVTAEIASGDKVDAVVSTHGIIIEFDSVTAGGNILAKQQSADDLPAGSFVEVKANGDAILSIDSSTFQTVGKIYEITPSHTLGYDGSITLTLPYDEDLVNQTGLSEDKLRLVHYIDGQWEDTTLSVNFANNTITGKLDSLSPVVVAAVNDETFGQTYFDQHPLSEITVHDTGIVDGNLTLTEVVRGQEVSISAQLNHHQRTDQPYVYIVQVLSPSGIVESLVVDSGSLSGGDVSKISTPWKSSGPAGPYSITILIISSLEQPELLAQPKQLQFKLV